MLGNERREAARKVIDDGKKMIGVRVACTVDLVKLPAATNPKSKAGMVREAKRLLAQLEVDLPRALREFMETGSK